MAACTACLSRYWRSVSAFPGTIGGALSILFSSSVMMLFDRGRLSASSSRWKEEFLQVEASDGSCPSGTSITECDRGGRAGGMHGVAVTSNQPVEAGRMRSKTVKGPREDLKFVAS